MDIETKCKIKWKTDLKIKWKIGLKIDWKAERVEWKIEVKLTPFVPPLSPSSLWNVSLRL